MIRGTKRKIDAEIHANIHNRFDIEVVDAKTGEIKQKAQAENIILNQLWTRLLAPNTYFNYIHYGSGTETPTATDTSLTTFVGSLNIQSTAYSIEPENNVVSCKRMAQINENTAVGISISEVGIAYGTAASNLCTKALLKDMNGNHLVINKTDTDIINIYATVFVHWEDSYGNGIETSPLIAYSNFVTNYLTGKSTGSLSMSHAISNGLLPEVSSNGTYQYLYGSDSSESGRYGYVYDAGASISTNYNANTKSITYAITRISVSEHNFSRGYKYVSIYERPSMYPRYYSSVYETNSYWFLPIFNFEAASWFGGCDIVNEPVGTGDGSATGFVTQFPISSNPTVMINGVATSANVNINRPIRMNDMGCNFKLIKNSLNNGENGFSGRTGYCNLPTKRSISYSPSLDSTSLYYNPYYEYGIATFDVDNASGKMYVSNDLNIWHELNITSTGTKIMPEEYRFFKYMKLVSDGTGATSFLSNITAYNLKSYDIEFEQPPNDGDVITCTYHTDNIAKDENHVFDFECTIYLGEKTS